MMSDGRRAKTGGDGRRGRLPLAILLGAGLLLSIGALSGWLLLRWEDGRVQARRAEAAELGHAHLRLLSERLNANLSVAHALAILVKHGGGAIDDFQRVGVELLGQFPTASELQLAPGGVVRQVAPLAGSERQIGLDLLHDRGTRSDALRAVQTRRLTVVGPVALAGGAPGIAGCMPVFTAAEGGDATFWGFVSVVFPVERVLAGTGIDLLPERGFAYVLSRRAGDGNTKAPIAASGGAMPPGAIELGFGVPNAQWTLALAPRGGWLPAAERWPARLTALAFCLVAWVLALRLLLKPVRLQDEVDRRSRALRDSEERFRTVVRSIPDLVWLKDPDGRYLGCNRRFEKFFGARVADIVGRTDADFADTQFVDAARCGDRDVLETGCKTVSEQWITFASDGHMELVQIVRTPMRSKGGELTGVLCVARDITDLHHMKEGYRASEARLAAAQKVARIGSWERNVDTGEIYWSDEIYRLLGLEPAQTAPDYDAFMQAIHPEDRDWVHSAYRDACQKQVPLQIQLRISVAGAAVRHIEMRAEMPRSEDGACHRIVGTLQDISDRIEAQERIRRQQAMTRAMLSAMPVGVAITDAAGRLREFNAAASDLLLTRPAELVGRRICELGLSISDGRGRALASDELPDAVALSGGQASQEVELSIGRADQSNEVAISAVPVAGEDMGVVIALVSLKARREAERSLREHAERIDALNRRFSVAASAAGIGVWDYDLATQSFTWDEAMLHLHGIDAERFDGSLACWLERVAAGDRERLSLALERARGGDDEMAVDFRVVRRGGITHYLRASARAVRDSKGGVRRLSGVCLDMTTLKRSEQILIQERRRYRDLVDSTDGIVWEAEAADGKFTYVSRHAERLLGYPIQSWYEPDFWRRHLHPDDREWAANYSTRMTASLQGHEFEYRMLAQDGRVVWLRDIVTVVPEDGEARWVRGVMVDISATRNTAEALKRSEEKLSLAVEGAGLGLWDWDIDSGELDLGGQGLSMLGYAPGEVEARFDGWEALIHPDDLARVQAELVEHLQGRSERFVCEYRLRHRQPGRWVWVHGLGQIMHHDEAGVPLRAAGIQLDVTDRRQAEERARKAQLQIERLSARNALLLDSAGEGIFGVDLDKRCIFINPMALELLGVDEYEALDRDVDQLFEHRHADGHPYAADACPISLTLRDGVKRQVEDTLVRRDGRTYAVRMTVTEMREGDRRIGAEVVFQDISTRRAMERELERLATTDPLTGVTNRRQFIERCEQELVRQKRFEDPVSLLMIDVDHFKRVNDNHGHAAGDEVLRHLCTLAQKELRRTDVFARLGGEEFAFLLTGSDLDGALEFAGRFRSLVASQPARTEIGSVAVTISIGAAQAARSDRNADDLLRRADKALYRAKQGGRNRVEAGSV